MMCVCMFKEEKIVLNRKKKLKGSGSRDFNSDFVFRERDTLTCDDAWVSADVMKQLKIKVCVYVCDAMWSTSLCSSLLVPMILLLFSENFDNSGPENREDQEKEESRGECCSSTSYLAKH